MWKAVALCIGLVAAPARAVETMRIEMGLRDSEASLRSRAIAFGPDSDDALRYTPVPGGKVTVRRAGPHLEINGVPFPSDTVRFRAGEEGLDAGVPGREGIHTGDLEVRGDVVVRASGDGLQLINVIPLEDYLVAVLGSEMPSKFPEEALKAQAVAARTYALRKKLEGLGKPHHLGSTVLSQVYGGLRQEDPRTRIAVEATRGQVLTFDLEPIEAYFHASCGGRTESGEAALERDLPYLRPVDCPCGKLPVSHWTLSVPSSELRSLFGAREVDGLTIVARSETGRARRLASAGHGVDAVTFRRKLGYGRVKSLSFELKKSGDVVRMVGKGFGHGAGLCQWGAKLLAEEGYDYRRILAHYYPGTELQRLY
jgi:stage II sporulation protein D